MFGVSDFDAFHDLMNLAGFSQPSTKELPIAWRTASLDPYLSAFRDWANLKAMPEGTVKRIEETVRERANAYRSGSDYVMPNPAILVSGKK